MSAPHTADRGTRAPLAPGSTRPAVSTGISISHLSVEFDDPATGVANRVLDDLSIDSPPGEFLVIIGRSGCGKTTVLNVLSGLIQDHQGTVSFDGKAPRLARQQMGYMFARDALIASRTALANVEIGLEIRRVPRKHRREIAQGLIRVLGLDGAERRYPWQLSQGMRQRVALARTWAMAPALILMDEPFAALDAQTRESVRSAFLQLWERDRSNIVFVTHDLGEALLLADRVVVMGLGGRILEDIRLPFARPRDPGTLPYTEDFTDLERRLHRLLEPADPTASSEGT
ncbi:ABC transporter ATP-binding protein [Nakamurella alba]|uniref:ABC transporter ATP-binding protein n=1 Tax=Nakamurella alba TaxID=2665158 RepID=UPI0018A8D5FF|nr:ABC transporter ATP-binding protein [Nakamurella alba]